jgi:hypothetical protein
LGFRKALLNGFREIEKNLFYDGFTGRPVTGGPLPFLVKAKASIQQNLGLGETDAGHQFTSFINVVITHIKRTIVVANSNKMAICDLTTGVFGPNDVSILVIVEYCIGPDLAGP